MKHLWKANIRYVYIVAVIVLLASAFLGILIGASNFSLSDFTAAITAWDSPSGNILWYVRIPRVLSSLLCGGALAVSGAVIQGVLANRLASPSIIGVNSGAGLAVTLSTALGIVGGWRLSAFAFLGAFAAVMAVSLGAKRWGASRGTVILMGVAMNSLLGAISESIKLMSPEVGVLSNDFRIGDFSGVSYSKLLPASVVIIIAFLTLMTLSNELDVLTLGDENAKSLGLNTGIMRTLFLMLSAALAGTAVSIAGLLSFVGLLVPHAVRRISTGEARHLIPLCGLFGAGFVTICDTLARTIFAPYELPVGIIMAFLGAPFFLFILVKGKGGHSRA
ncbi:MAG TPA: iron ABC transporter permease [Candidatus Alectryocaccobium stercorigallinarum]|nr:iron ABC transporter permease [Candidatus Alectryocaccobium stercorigallinarum]